MNDQIFNKNGAQRTRKQGLGLLSSAVSAAMFASVVPQVCAAQLTLEEIVVTAERREASVQEIPIAIAAFNGEQLEAFGVNNAEEMQTITPGLVMTKTGTSPSFFLRGIGARTAATGFEPSISIYQDER